MVRPQFQEGLIRMIAKRAEAAANRGPEGPSGTSRDPRSPRRGLTRIESAVAVAVAAVAAGLLAPAILSSTESARRVRCSGNFRRIGLALHAYHDAHGVLPPAAVWEPGPFASMALHQTKRIDVVTHANWAQLLLPHLGREDLARAFDPSRPVAAPGNEAGRTAALPEFACPSDEFNRADNPHVFEPVPGRPIRFARGNCAINGGTHCFKVGPGDPSAPVGDPAHLVVDPERREFRFWGNGVAGFNVSFSLDEFENGVGTLAAVDEIRAGIHALDPRGSWALGQVGASVAWGHGVNGDDFGPNNPWPRSDDVLGGPRLNEVVGREKLAEEAMPCVWYVDVNQNATARSRHPGGVHVLFLDGATRFVADGVDPGLWHVMHSRETPRETLADCFEERLAAGDAPEKARDGGSGAAADGPAAGESPPTFSNSLGMEFVGLPAGEFLMGRPDAGNDAEPSPETPPHRVRITRPFRLGRCEVTRGDYGKVMHPDPELTAGGTAQDADFPVVDVTWHEAAEFCRRLSARPEERAARRRYRLPTEAEWEYACRAGADAPYRWRPRREPDDATGEAAGMLPPLPIGPVASYPANAFGLCDMRGNAWEWTADWFDRDYYARSPIDDPRGPAEGYLKVVRGGDWTFVGEACRIGYPTAPPWKRNPFVGFRVVCDAAPAEHAASPGLP